MHALEAELHKQNEITQDQNKLLQNLRLNEEKLKFDVKSLEAHNTELEVEVTYNLQEITNIKNKYEQDTTLLTNNLKRCQSLIEKKILFNDEQNELYNSFNSSKKYVNNVRKFTHIYIN